VSTGDARRSPQRAFLESLLKTGLARVDAGDAVRRALSVSSMDAAEVAASGRRPSDSAGRSISVLDMAVPDEARLFVLAAGKAACAMAAALESIAGPRVARGLAVTKQGHTVPLERFSVRETAHPVPDARCAAAGREALALAMAAQPQDVFLVLLSGGASALLSTPPAGVTPIELARTNALLLACGADIDETNTVRKHLSEVSGGRLALATRAQQIVVLAISDVPEDRLDVIGSGPCAPDPTTFGDALDVVRRRGIETELPPAVLARLNAGAAGRVDESPKPGDPQLARVRHAILARNVDALDAMRDAAEKAGVSAHVRPGSLLGEARDAARRLLVEADRAAAQGRERPHVLLAGGETTVRLRGNGRGGRNQELALAAAIALEGRTDRALLAAGTDGSDGPTAAAGAFADGGTVTRGATSGVDARAALARNDSNGFFSMEGGLVVTGPTHTNVMDVALVLAGDAPAF
jgi:glycerate-2-kinase